MTNIKTIFRRQNILDIFLTTFLFITGFRIRHSLRNVRILHLYIVQNPRYRPARWASLSQTQLGPIPPGRPLPSILTATALQGHPSGIMQGQQPAWRRHVSPEQTPPGPGANARILPWTCRCCGGTDWSVITSPAANRKQGRTTPHQNTALPSGEANPLTTARAAARSSPDSEESVFQAGPWRGRGRGDGEREETESTGSPAPVATGREQTGALHEFVPAGQLSFTECGTKDGVVAKSDEWAAVPCKLPPVQTARVNWLPARRYHR